MPLNTLIMHGGKCVPGLSPKFSVKWNFLFQVLVRCMFLCLRLFLTHEIRVCPQLLLRFLPTLSHLYRQEPWLFTRQSLWGCVFFARLVRLILAGYSCFKARLKRLVWSHEWPGKWERQTKVSGFSIKASCGCTSYCVCFPSWLNPDLSCCAWYLYFWKWLATLLGNKVANSKCPL